MENIFTKTGYSISLKKENKNDVVVTLLTINNADGTPRWIWNANSNHPLFLKFYNISSKKAFVFATLIKLVFALKLQKLVFKKMSYYFSVLDNPVFDCSTNWVLFTGTIGPNRKAVLYANNSFYKIAITPNASQLIRREYDVLEKINPVISSFEIPKATIISKDIVQLNDVSKNGERIKKITSNHLAALLEFYTVEKQTIKVGDWDLFNSLKNDFRSINDPRIPKNLTRKINTILDTIPDNELIELSLSHGDFTPWNMYQKKDKLAIYDWELAQFDRPKAFDYFHFIIQNGILVNHESWEKIYADIRKIDNNSFASIFFNYDLEELNNYLKYYLLINCMQYLKIYSEQKNWHIQIDWLFQVWNEGFNIFVTNEYSSRELIIMDIFDSIQNQEYAALKFQNGFPEKLSLNSDIDLVIDKKMNDSILKTLQRHDLVSKVTFSKKSFMNSIQILTNDADMLSLDLIWQLKRRNFEILDAKKIIHTSFTNNYGIKNASSLYTARYVVLFYILNGAKIPKKYLIYQEAFANSKKTIDFIIKDYFDNSKKSKQLLLNYINSNKQNKGINHIKNTINYCLDTIKNYQDNKGFIVTFSGVDGAGKSTVIENIAFRIEKQLRKPVKILRHRPSILPILSVWTKGKEKAHQDAISSLPRQGKNGSFVSSFLRFTYYYSDYLFGQFVIYFKYTSRGYVVIYDRYYFDFINDSKRSNIVLPKIISKLGYYLLLKPKFNFFLFADANVILNRKKELTKATIEELTKEYSVLFDSLSVKSNSSIYESINNEELDVTLNHIVKTIILT
jgi:thymidylate kinase